MHQRTNALVENVGYEMILDSVYGPDQTSEQLNEGSFLTLKGLIMESVKDIWFDIFLENHYAVEARLLEALQDTHRWRRICPEKAQPIVTYKEWQAKKIHELELSSLSAGKAIINSL